MEFVDSRKGEVMANMVLTKDEVDRLIKVHAFEPGELLPRQGHTQEELQMQYHKMKEKKKQKEYDDRYGTIEDDKYQFVSVRMGKGKKRKATEHFASGVNLNSPVKIVNEDVQMPKS